MIDYDIFKKIDRDEQCVNFAYAVNSLVTAARFALENDAGGIRDEQCRSCGMRGAGNGRGHDGRGDRRGGNL